MESGDAKLEEFIHVTVPRILDDQNGAVSRKLQKAHETFDIENAKIIKREQKARQTLFLSFFSFNAFDHLRYFLYHTCPLHTKNSGRRKREAHINWAKVKPKKAAPVTQTTSRTTGPVPIDSRQ